MDFLRKAAIFILAGLLPFFLWALAIDVGLLKAAGSSTPIKKVLSDSGIYNSIVPGLLDDAKTSGGDQGGGVSLTDPSVKQVAEKTFTPQYLQQNTEKVLDSIYAWLDGKTPQPEFSIDVSSLKATFASEAGKAAQTKAAALPVCTTFTPTSDFDVFSATCIPRGLTPAAVATQVQNDINSGQGFIKDTTINADSLKDETDCPEGGQCTSKNVFQDQYKNAPRVFQDFKKSPVVLGLLALLATLGIIFLSSERRRGVRRAGIIFLIAGVLMLALAWGLDYGINHKAIPKMNLDNKALQANLSTLVHDVTAKITGNYYIFGGVFAALGAVAVFVPMFFRRGKATITPAVDDEPKPVKKTPTKK